MGYNSGDLLWLNMEIRSSGINWTSCHFDSEIKHLINSVKLAGMQNQKPINPLIKLVIAQPNS